MRKTATITNIGYSILNGLAVSLQGFDYVHYIYIEDISAGGKNSDVTQIKVGSKISFDKDVTNKRLRNVVILSDGIREVDEEGILIKW